MANDAHTTVPTEMPSGVKVFFSSKNGQAIPWDRVHSIIEEAQNNGWECRPMVTSGGIRRVVFSSSSDAEFGAELERSLMEIGFERYSDSHYPDITGCSWDRTPSLMKAGYNGVRRCVPEFK